MNFIVVVLLSAVILAVADILSKKVLQRRHSMEFNAAISVVMLGFLLLVAPLVLQPIGIKELLIIFVISLLLSAELHFFARGLRHLDISIAIPLMELVPLVVVILAVLFLDETPSSVNVFGMILLICGAFLINIDISQKTFFIQLKELVKSKYVHLLLVAVILGGVVAILQKSEIERINPISMGWWMWLFVSINLIIIYLVQQPLSGIKVELRDYGPLVVIIAVLTIGSSFLYLAALPLAFISIILPLRRLSALVSVVAGGQLFAEKHVVMRSVATFIMLIGAVLVIL